MKIILIMSLILYSVISLFELPLVYSAIITATDCSQTEVQKAITSAVDGDTVFIPSGACTWTTSVSWSNKNINVLGAGIDKTVINGNETKFKIINTTKSSFRISSMNLVGEFGSAVISLRNDSGKVYSKGWRIDHIRFKYGGSSSNTNAFVVIGVNWGLVDNCIFDTAGIGKGYAIMTQYAYYQGEASLQPPNSGYYAHSLPINLGTDEAIYIEDCTVNFTGAKQGTGSFVFNQAYGGNLVLRHNYIKGTYLQNHSARMNDRGAVSFEIYNNNFLGDTFYRPALFRSGTGVIFNNTVSGYSGTNNFNIDNQRTCLEFTGTFDRCDGTNTYDGNTKGEYGWPCVDQIGRGQGQLGAQVSMPLYGWNNGSTPTCASGGECDNSSLISLNANFDLCISSVPPNLSTHLKTTGDPAPHSGGIVDYVNNGSTPKPGYNPFVYPHPLRKIDTVVGLKLQNE